MADENRRLLVIDDDPGIRSQMRWGFDNFEVITADDRSEALELLNQYRPKVVTLDLGLPPDAEGVTEGFAVLAEIMHRAPDTKVVIISGQPNDSNRMRAEKSGVYEFCSKPINLQQLSRIIEKAYQAAQ